MRNWCEASIDSDSCDTTSFPKWLWESASSSALSTSTYHTLDHYNKGQTLAVGSGVGGCQELSPDLGPYTENQPQVRRGAQLEAGVIQACLQQILNFCYRYELASRSPVAQEVPWHLQPPSREMSVSQPKRFSQTELTRYRSAQQWDVSSRAISSRVLL